MKEKISFLGGAVIAIAFILFAVQLMFKNTEQNLVTWILWTILDVFLLITTIQAGNKRPWIVIGCLVGVLAVTVMLMRQAVWHWGFMETLCTTGVIVSAIIWIKLGAKKGVIAGVIAMNTASLPNIYRSFHHPDPSVAWLWIAVAFGCLLCTLGSKSWKAEDRLFPFCGIFGNSVMAVLDLR